MIRDLLRAAGRRVVGRLERTLFPPPPRAAAPTSFREEEPEGPPIELSGAAVREQLAAGQALVLLDVREHSELALSGRARGATHIPLGQLQERQAELPRDRRLVVYCAAGGRSHGAAAYLRAHGFPDAWSLAGGLPAWVRAGGEVERG